MKEVLAPVESIWDY